jgi:hypothetical protein
MLCKARVAHFDIIRTLASWNEAAHSTAPACVADQALVGVLHWRIEHPPGLAATFAHFDDVHFPIDSSLSCFGCAFGRVLFGKLARLGPVFGSAWKRGSHVHHRRAGVCLEQCVVERMPPVVKLVVDRAILWRCELPGELARLGVMDVIGPTVHSASNGGWSAGIGV